MNGLKTQTDSIFRIIEKVADSKGVDPKTLTPIYEAIDPDALSTLLTTPRYAASRSLSVQFTYEGYEVTAHDDGRVELSPTS